MANYIITGLLVNESAERLNDFTVILENEEGQQLGTEITLNNGEFNIPADIEDLGMNVFFTILRESMPIVTHFGPYEAGMMIDPLNRVSIAIVAQQIECGQNAYVYIAYADDESGSGFTSSFEPDKPFIAILSTNTPIETPVVEDFDGLWVRYRGENGAQGIQGIQGPQGIQGIQGPQGNSITATSIQNGDLYITISGQAPQNVGTVRGADGRGISNIELTTEKILIINYSDDTQDQIDLTFLDMATQQYSIKGVIANINGLPLSGKTVKAFHKNLDIYTQLGQNATTSASGEYEITFDQSEVTALAQEKPDVVVRVYDTPEGQPVITSPLIIDASENETINLAIGEGSFKGLVEYNFINGRLGTTVTEGNVETYLSADQVADLAKKTNSTVAEVNQYVQVKKVAKDTTLSENMLFGLARTGNYRSLAAMMTASPSELEEKLTQAVAEGKLDSAIDAGQITSFVTSLKDKAVQSVLDPGQGNNAAINTYFTAVGLSTAQKQAFVGNFLTTEGDVSAFWTALREDGAFTGAEVDDIEAVSNLIGLTGDTTLANELFSGGYTVQSLAALEKSDVTTLLDASSITWDDRFPGENLEEKKDNYATFLMHQVENEHPTQVFVANVQRTAEVTNTNFETFFTNQAAFRFEGQPVASYLENNPTALDFIANAEERDAFRQDLEGMQRLFKVAPQNDKFSSIAPMWIDGVRSATDIQRMGEASFTERYGATLGADTARAVFHSSAALAASTLHVLANFKDDFNVLSTAVIQNYHLTNADNVGGLPNLEDLFGAQDLCSCEHCRSVYSPAAYMVDLLHWLSAVNVTGVSGINNLKMAIDARRPEIQNILLTCENTNTPLPYVDLVNEVLENFIVDVLNLVPGPLYDRQTTQKAAFLKAHPEYVRPEVYDILRKQVYPWTAPFDLFEAEAQVYFEHLGIDFSGVLRLFQPSLTAGDIAAKDLKINPLEKAIIIDDSATVNTLSGATIGFTNYFGGATIGSLQASVKLLMEKSGLTYNEIEDYFESKFINSSGWIIGFTGPDCDPTTATTNMPDTGLLRMMRFHKLRRHLDWTLEQLDRAILTLPGGSVLNDLKLARISGVRDLAIKYKLDIDEVSAWYGDLNTTEYSGKPSYFSELFVNPSVNNTGETYTIVDPLLTGSSPTVNVALTDLFDPANVTTSTYKVFNKSILPLVLGGTRLTDQEAALLLTNGAAISVANLSYLYRVSIFCKALRISVEEYLKYVTLFDTEPILPLGTPSVTPEPSVTERFIELVLATKKLGLTVDALDYIITNATTDAALDTDEWLDRLVELQAEMNAAKAELHIVGDDTRSTVIQYLNLFVGFEFPNAAPWTRADLDLLISILDGASTLDEMDPPSTTSDSQENVVETMLADLLTPAQIQTIVETMVDSSHANYRSTENIEDRYATAFQRNTLTGLTIMEARVELVMWPVIRRRLILEAFAGYFELNTDTLTELIEQHLSHYNGTTLVAPYIDWYTREAFLSDDIKTTGAVIYGQNGIILHKAALLCKALRLGTGENDLNYLFDAVNATALPALVALNTDLSASIAQFNELWLIGREHVGYAVNGSLFSILYDANDGGGNPAIHSALQDLTGWREIEETCGTDVFNFATADFYTPSWYFKVKTVSLANAASMVKPIMLKQWVVNNGTASIAQALSNACKSKHGETQWLRIAPELRDVIRIQQRDALADYIIFQVAGYSFSDRYSLYEYFLIDTEMEPCQLTSRIVQANGTIQLFVQRLIMNLEQPEFKLNKDHVREWEWRKNYRVWEANRKVFLYPENWIEPELRDDKTNFFRELEEELLQQDITMETATTAYLNYVEKLDEVADMQVAQFFKDLETNVLHVFSRTKSHPHVYYHRKWVDDAWWTHWEKVEVDIEGNHLIPVVYNGRLMIFWPTIMEQAYGESSSNMAATSGSSYTPKTTRKKFVIHMNWSELKNKKWTKRKRSNNAIEIEKAEDWFGPEDLYFKTSISSGNILYVEVNRLTGSHSAGFTITHQGNFAFEGTNKAPRIEGSTGKAYNYAWPVQFEYGERGQTTLTTKAYSGDNVEIAIMDDHNDSTTPYNNWSYPLLYAWLSAPSYVVMGHQVPIKTIEVYGNMPFFYYDNKHTYFVRPEGYRYPIYAMAATFIGDWVTASIGDTTFTVMEESALSTDTFGYRGSSEFFIAEDSSAVINGRVAFDTGVAEGTTYQLILEGYETRYKYRFHSFDHQYVTLIAKQLNRWGLEGLLRPVNGRTPQDTDLDRQQVAVDHFQADYDPDSYNVLTPYPKKDIDFSFGGGYSIYNWELFFHAPLLVACELTKNQRFEEAQKWFHFIFDPTQVETNIPTEQGLKRFWRTKPFHTYNGETSINALMQMLNDGDQEMEKQVEVWRRNPFMPHAIARLRWVAYMKNVVMKYIDMLIAWGDMLFAQDTMESVNEATQVYLMAAQILGRRPELIDRDGALPQSYNQLAPYLDSFSNAMVAVENVLPMTHITSVISYGNVNLRDYNYAQSTITSVDMFYFCIPKNDKLWGYWDIVYDRLFKIRHCLNIEGVFRQLPLFAPPIDPAMLVKAAASGLSIGAALNDMNAPMPFYKFSYLYQKALELTNDVIALGGALLSALEKKDAEALSLLRNTQEVKLLEATTAFKKRAIDEAEQNIKALQATKVVTEERMRYYKSRKYMNPKETTQMVLMGVSMVPQGIAAVLQGIQAPLALFPDLDFGVSGFGGTPTVKAKLGGSNISAMLGAAASALQTTSGIISTGASMAGILGGYDRRSEDWGFQGEQAALEIRQIDLQILAAQIRKAMAEADLSNHLIQIEHAKETGVFMKEKFTNEELYSWMSKETSKIYFKAYQMAFDTAKKAEKAYHYETGFDDTDQYIGFGMWDSLRKGLLAGERLRQDLRRLDIAFTDKNKRDIELSKKVSLAMLNPEALERLKQTGKCDFDLTEMLYDLDHPGHYMRRIKAVTVSIPCVVGPYTGVTGKLSLLSNRIRTNSLAGSGYAETVEDPRFVYNITGIQSIATSRGQDDSGMFELNFNDVRYLPFEGAGAISSWRFELPFTFSKDGSNNPNPTLRQFDYSTIADLILTVHYTARDAGATLKTAAEQNLLTNLNQWIVEMASSGLYRVFSMKHEFPTEYHQFMNPVGGNSHTTTFAITHRHFPYALHTHDKETVNVAMLVKLKEGYGPVTTFNAAAFDLVSSAGSFGSKSALPSATSLVADIPMETFTGVLNAVDDWTLTATPANLATNFVGTDVLDGNNNLVPEAIDDIILVMHYTKA